MTLRRRRTETATPDEPELPLPPHGAAPPSSAPATMSCPGCRASISATELATYGNRCRQCYQAFCSANQATRALPRYGGPLGWAHTIVERHKEGQAITPAQLQMAKDALAFRSFSLEETER